MAWKEITDPDEAKLLAEAGLLWYDRCYQRLDPYAAGGYWPTTYNTGKCLMQGMAVPVMRGDMDVRVKFYIRLEE